MPRMGRQPTEKKTVTLSSLRQPLLFPAKQFEPGSSNLPASMRANGCTSPKSLGQEPEKKVSFR